MAEPILEEKKSFAKGLYKITKEDQGKIICILNEKCLTYLTSNQVENEVEITFDLIVFHKVTNYIKSIIGNNASSARKKKTSTSKPSSAKKSPN